MTSVCQKMVSTQDFYYLFIFLHAGFVLNSSNSNVCKLRIAIVIIVKTGVGTSLKSFQGPLKVDFRKPGASLFMSLVRKAAACLKISLPSLHMAYYYSVFPSKPPCVCVCSPSLFVTTATGTDWVAARLPPSMFNPIMPPHTQT